MGEIPINLGWITDILTIETSFGIQKTYEVGTVLSAAGLPAIFGESVMLSLLAIYCT